ncbi:unnamed protein product [Prorocentrum cordatum]|uniref:Phospholipid scramblase n=1 Tax=Prorocentrum cordatum TaxID=2364126 RepID=A0ABN9Q0W5_9DINO|nr:unnamed protein product [Polarella glacialis]
MGNVPRLAAQQLPPSSWPFARSTGRPCPTSGPSKRARNHGECQPGGSERGRGVAGPCRQFLRLAVSRVVVRPRPPVRAANLQPGFQRRPETVEVRRTDGSREVMARAVASRDGTDVVVESSLRMPVVLLRLQRGPGLEGTGVAVLKATPSFGGLRDGAPPLCTIRAGGAGEGFVAWHGTAADRAVLLALRLHGGDDGGPANVVDGEGRLLSAVESLSGDAGQSLQLLHVAQGVDSTLVIAAVVAAQMLRDA